MPVDASRDHEVKIEEFKPEELVFRDWDRSEQDTGYGTFERENIELLDQESRNAILIAG